MNLYEYINQTDPVRQSVGSVVLKREDCDYVSDWMNTNSVLPKIRVISIRLFDRWCEYRQNSDSDILYTVDQDGNRKRPSVFSLPINS